MPLGLKACNWYGLGLQSHMRLEGEVTSPKVMCSLAALILVDWWTEGFSFLLAVSWRLSSVPCHHDHLLPQSQQERDCLSKTGASILCNIIMYM